jgi:hypothetical protein
VVHDDQRRLAQCGVRVQAVQGFQQILAPAALVEDEDLGANAGFGRGRGERILQRPHRDRQPAGFERVLQPAPILGGPPDHQDHRNLLIYSVNRHPRFWGTRPSFDPHRPGWIIDPLSDRG